MNWCKGRNLFDRWANHRGLVAPLLDCNCTLPGLSFPYAGSAQPSSENR
jgi:hypothetical protein